MTDPETELQRAVAAASTTRDVTIAADALGVLPAVLARSAPAAGYAIVADANTWKAAGQRVAALLQAAGLPLGEPIVLAGEPRVKASAETAREVATRLAARQALPIAVGSGVINDLAKYAAELAGTAYVCVPTAASMDGYAASGAALREGGFKRTLACAAPVAIVADLGRDRRARRRSWAPGAMAIWWASWWPASTGSWPMRLGEEALNPGPFAMVQDNLAGWLDDPAGIRQGERGAIDGLVRGLVMSGLAMQAHGNSRPASGSDHQFAHLWEMEEIAVDGQPVSHGACVGVGCVSMLAAYEWLLSQDVMRGRPDAAGRAGAVTRRAASRGRAHRFRCRSWRPMPRSRPRPRQRRPRGSRRACGRS